MRCRLGAWLTTRCMVEGQSSVVPWARGGGAETIAHPSGGANRQVHIFSIVTCSIEYAWSLVMSTCFIQAETRPPTFLLWVAIVVVRTKFLQRLLASPRRPEQLPITVEPPRDATRRPAMFCILFLEFVE